MEEQLDVNLCYILGYITPIGNPAIEKSFLQKDCLEIINADPDVLEDVKYHFKVKGETHHCFLFGSVDIEFIHRQITRNGLITGLPLDEVPREKFLAYWLGVVNHIGGINTRNDVPELIIPLRLPEELSKNLIAFLKESKIPYFHGIGDSIIIKGVNCIDFLGKAYGTGVSKYSLSWKAHYNFARNYTKEGYLVNSVVEHVPKLRVAKKDPKAILPQKNKESDAGIDLTVISIEKILKIGSTDVYYFNTGLVIQPEPGYYFEIVPRSSISKTGWALANSVGIIDSSYRGCLLVVLSRMSPKTKDLELPCRIAQLIPRRIIPVDVEEIPMDRIEESSRGESGFGSSG